MKFFILLTLSIVCSRAFAASLIEFDSRDITLGEPSISIDSLETVTVNATKLDENLFEDKGGCRGCVLLYRRANYTISIPTSNSIDLKIVGEAAIFWAYTHHERITQQYSVPQNILDIEKGDPSVLRHVSDSAKLMMDTLGDVRRREVIFDKKTGRCFVPFVRGLYNPETLNVTSIHKESKLVRCI